MKIETLFDIGRKEAEAESNTDSWILVSGRIFGAVQDAILQDPIPFGHGEKDGINFAAGQDSINMESATPDGAGGDNHRKTVLRRGMKDRINEFGN